MSDRMLSDEILLGLIKKNGGGGGGTGDYNDLSNQPQIGGVTLKGNKSASDLGLASEENLAEKQNALNAGLYIEIDNDTISVKRDITQIAQEIAYNFTIPSDFTLRVKKYLNGDLVDTTDYTWNSVVDPINLDSVMEVSKKVGNYWVVKNLISSTTQAADYSVDLYALQQSTNYTQNFVATIDADKKLIIQSELDAAVAGKVDTDIVASDFSADTSYTAGEYCIYGGKFYKFKNNHSGAWAAADMDEIKIAGELATLRSGLIDKHGVYEYNLLVTLAEFDGVSSYGAYLTSAYNALQSYINNLPNGVLIHIDRMNIGDMAINNPSSRLGNNTNTVGSSLFAQFIASDIANGHSVIRKVDAIGKTYEMIDDGVYSDLTSNVPAAGGTISVNVTLYALLS